MVSEEAKLRLQSLKKDQQSLKDEIARLNTYMAKKSSSRAPRSSHRRTYDQDYNRDYGYDRGGNRDEDLLKMNLDQSQELMNKFDYLIDILLESMGEVEESNTDELIKTLAQSQMHVMEVIDSIKGTLDESSGKATTKKELVQLDQEMGNRYNDLNKKVNLLMEKMEHPEFVQQLDALRVGLSTLGTQVSKLNSEGVKVQSGGGTSKEVKEQMIEMSKDMDTLEDRLKEVYDNMDKMSRNLNAVQAATGQLSQIQNNINQMKDVLVAQNKQMLDENEKRLKEIEARIENSKTGSAGLEEIKKELLDMKKTMPKGDFPELTKKIVELQKNTQSLLKKNDEELLQKISQLENKVTNQALPEIKERVNELQGKMAKTEDLGRLQKLYEEVKVDIQDNSDEDKKLKDYIQRKFKENEVYETFARIQDKEELNKATQFISSQVEEFKKSTAIGRIAEFALKLGELNKKIDNNERISGQQIQEVRRVFDEMRNNIDHLKTIENSVQNLKASTEEMKEELGQQNYDKVVKAISEMEGELKESHEKLDEIDPLLNVVEGVQRQLKENEVSETMLRAKDKEELSGALVELSEKLNSSKEADKKQFAMLDEEKKKLLSIDNQLESMGVDLKTSKKADEEQFNALKEDSEKLNEIDEQLTGVTKGLRESRVDDKKQFEMLAEEKKETGEIKEKLGEIGNKVKTSREDDKKQFEAIENQAKKLEEMNYDVSGLKEETKGISHQVRENEVAETMLRARDKEDLDQELSMVSDKISDLSKDVDSKFTGLEAVETMIRIEDNKKFEQGLKVIGESLDVLKKQKLNEKIEKLNEAFNSVQEKLDKNEEVDEKQFEEIKKNYSELKNNAVNITELHNSVNALISRVKENKEVSSKEIVGIANQMMERDEELSRKIMGNEVIESMTRMKNQDDLENSLKQMRSALQERTNEIGSKIDGVENDLKKTVAREIDERAEEESKLRNTINRVDNKLELQKKEVAEKHERDFNDLIEKIQLTNNEVDKVKQEVVVDEEKMKDLNKYVDSIYEKTRELSRELGKEKNKEQELAEQIVSLQSKVRSLKKSALSKEDLEMATKMIEKEMNGLEKEIEDLHQEDVEKEEEAQEFKKDLDKLQLIVSEVDKKTEVELLSKIKDSQKELEKITQAKQEQIDLKTALSDMKKNIMDIKESAEADREAFKNILSRVDSLEKEISEKKENMNPEEFNRLGVKVLELGERIKQHEEKIGKVPELEERLKGLVDSFDSLDLTDFRNELTKLESAVKKGDDDYEFLRMRVDDLKKKVNQAIEGSLPVDKEELKKGLSEVYEDVLDLEMEKNGLNEVLKKLRKVKSSGDAFKAKKELEEAHELLNNEIEVMNDLKLDLKSVHSHFPELENILKKREVQEKAIEKEIENEGLFSSFKKSLDKMREVRESIKPPQEKVVVEKNDFDAAHEEIKNLPVPETTQGIKQAREELESVEKELGKKNLIPVDSKKLEEVDKGLDDTILSMDDDSMQFMKEKLKGAQDNLRKIKPEKGL